MRDEMFHREFDHGRGALNAGIDRLLARLAEVSRAAVRINFDAPWKSAPRTTQCR